MANTRDATLFEVVCELNDLKSEVENMRAELRPLLEKVAGFLGDIREGIGHLEELNQRT